MKPEKTAPHKAAPDTPPEEDQDCIEKQAFTQVPNAHAAGMGAMGRNDEKLPTASEDGPDQRDPAY